MTFKRLLIVLAALGVLVVAASLIAGSYLTSAAPQSIGSLPPGFNGRAVEFQSNSGSRIHGWLLPGQPGKGVVVLMHGVRSNRLSMMERARFLSNAGYSVLLFDFQAHGESTGAHITFGKLESRDAQAAVQFIRENLPGEKVAAIGVSMGGAASILASPSLNVDALVLEMVYPTIEEAVSDRLVSRLGPAGRFMAPLLLWQLRPRLGIEPQELHPIEQVAQLTMPKLFIAGADDKYTTLDESRRLFEKAHEPKEFWVIQGAAHVDLHNQARVEYEHRILEFLDRNLK